MASSRLKILKNKKDIQIKQLRRELAQLLESGQTQTARIRVEHVVREEKMVAAYELVGIYCELLVARLAVIDSQKNCPTDLKEAVASVLYASQRLADVPELSDIVKHFSAKYGKDFATGAVELRPNSGVSRLLVEKLSVKAPDGPTKVKILMEIAKEHNIEWEAKSFMEPDPKDSEVLSGPSSFQSASRTHEDSPRAPDKEPPNFQAPPAVNVQDGSSERNHVPVNPYTHDERKSSTHAHNFTPDVNLGKTSDSYHPNARPPGYRTHAGEYRHPNPDDESNSHRSRRKCEMEFVDATDAARAAAESAERASIAARAAAELSSKERMMRQNSTDSQSSLSSYSNRNEHQHRGSSSNLQSEGRPSPRRNGMQYEEMGSAKKDNFSRVKASDHFEDELSETEQGRRGRHSRENLEMRQTDSFAKSNREWQPNEHDLDVGYSDEVQIRKQSSRASSRSHSRTFPDDHAVASNYIKSPSLEENIFASADKYQPQRSPEETYHHDIGHSAAAFDEYDSFFDKPRFDKEGTYNDKSDYGLGSSLLGDKTHAREGTNAWSSAGHIDKSPGKLSSIPQAFQEKPTSPVFDSTGPAVSFHKPERSAKFDDYGPDSESEVDELSKKDEISGEKPVKERLKSSTSCSSPRFQDPDELGHEFFPSDADEPVYDSGTREESDSETQMGLRFGALTGGLKNKKTRPPYRMSPARDATLSKPEKEYTKTDVDQSMSYSPSASSRSNRKELYTEKARNSEKKTISAPPDPSSSDEDSEKELPGSNSIRQQDRRTKTQTRASYLRSITRNQEMTDKQTTGARDHKRPNAKTQASTLNLLSPFSDDENENKVRENTPPTNAKPKIEFSRRTKSQGKAPEKSSSPAIAKTDKGSYGQQSPTKSQPKEQPLSASSSLPKVVTSANTENADASSVETPSKERASHVHPKLPDYDDLLATLGSHRPNRR
ncbi:PREDICTED: protein IWS1 homolog A-like [Tarenaya hassleriana]|uniref:protein IWS1 homolog A-like n=1 Tax=Tarenaya hassleriana TaxID=28532 RepID=UPI00053C1211|nr:PREDICTED: protein IWS1 homolog A-like [Tarenaya hassleriana]